MTGPTAEERHEFTMTSAGAVVGAVTVDQLHEQLTISSHVWNNGRGSRLQETVSLGGSGAPAAWTVTGTAEVGAEVDERFAALPGGAYEWRSRSDAELQTLVSDAVLAYVPLDTSLLSTWFHVRAAHANGGSVGALPSGTLHARSLARFESDLSEGPLEGASMVTLTGASLQPHYVLAGSGSWPLAVWDGGLGLLVATGLEDRIPELTALFERAERESLREISARVTRRFDVPVRFSNVRVFEPAGRRLSEPKSVTIFGGRITTVQPEHAVVPADQEVVVDGAGGVLLPGLHDMHAHVAARNGLFYLAAGVTTVRDMGNDNATLPAIVDGFDAGEIAGPTVVPSGLIEGQSPFSVQMGMVVETLEEGLACVRWYAARGYYQLKVYNSVDPAWVPALAAEAHRLGMRVAGHVPAFTTADRMVEAGYDEVTHVNQLMLGWLLQPGEDTRTPLRLTAMTRAADLDLQSPPVRHTIELLRRRSAGLDTTLVAFERLMLSRDGTVIAADQPYLDHAPPAYQRERRCRFVPETAASDHARYDLAFQRMLEVVGLLHAEGVKLWPGTDDGTGFTLHRELELYVAAGIPPAEVLAIATEECATHLGLGESHGSIERGKVASFVLLDGDPTVDIAAVRQVRATVHRGALTFPDELYPALGVEPFYERPVVTGPSPA